MVWRVGDPRVCRDHAPPGGDITEQIEFLRKKDDVFFCRLVYIIWLHTSIRVSVRTFTDEARGVLGVGSIPDALSLVKI